MLWQMHNVDALSWLSEQTSAEFDALVTDPPYSSGGLHMKDRVKDSANNKYLNKPGLYPEFAGDQLDPGLEFQAVEVRGGALAESVRIESAVDRREATGQVVDDAGIDVVLECVGHGA